MKKIHPKANPDKPPKPKLPPKKPFIPPSTVTRGLSTEPKDHQPTKIPPKELQVKPDDVYLTDNENHPCDTTK